MDKKHKFSQFATDTFKVDGGKDVSYLKQLTHEDLKKASLPVRNMNLILRLFEEKNIDVIDQYFAPIIRVQDLATGQDAQLKSIKDFDVLWAKSFTQNKLEINDIIGSDTRVVVYWTWHAIHDKGSWKNIPVTNKNVKSVGITIYQIYQEKIKEITQLWDNLSLIEQIGSVTFQANEM